MKELDYDSIFAQHLLSGESHRECVLRYTGSNIITRSVAERLGVNFRTLQSYIFKIDNGPLSESTEHIDYLSRMKKYLSKIRKYLENNNIYMDDVAFAEWLNTSDAEQLIRAASRLGRI